MPSKKNLATFMKDSKNTSFLGTPIAQWHADLWLWEKFFSRNKIRSFIELGTGSGGLSMFFILQSMQHDFKFTTFDIASPEALNTHVGKLLNLKSHFRQGEIITEMREEITGLLKYSDRPVLLYCDNGNKPVEVRIYSKLLSDGDFVAVHDWDKEFNKNDIPHGLELLDFSEVDIINSYTRWLRRKS